MTLDVAGIFALEHDLWFLMRENEDVFTSYKKITARVDKQQFIHYSFLPQRLNELFSSKLDSQVRSAAASLRNTVSQIVNERYELASQSNNLQLGFLNQMVLSGNFTPSESVDYV